MVKDLEQVPGVIKTELGYRFSNDFLESLDPAPVQLFEEGIVRFDNGKLNSYYILCLTLTADWGFAKFNRDKTFNSLYVQDRPGVENRYDPEGNLVCQYYVDGHIYTKSTDGSRYVTGGSWFESGNKQYYYVR